MILFGNIHKGLEEYRSTPGAILVDVREAEEFASLNENSLSSAKDSVTSQTGSAFSAFGVCVITSR